MTLSEAMEEILKRHLSVEPSPGVESVQHDKGTLTVNFETGQIKDTSNGSEPFYNDPFAGFESHNEIIEEMSNPGNWREWWNQQQGNTNHDANNDKLGRD